MKINIPKPLVRLGLKVSKKSPELCVAAGVLCVLGGVIAAAVADPSEAIDEHKEKVEKLKELKEGEELYSNTTYAKDLTVVYGKTGIKLAKTYAVTTALTTSGIIFILAGHGIMRKRNAALVAAYNVLQDTFRAYRQRVLEDPDAGEEKDRYYSTGFKNDTIEVVETNEKGKEVKKKETAIVFDGKVYSQYARFFDESCKGWEKSPEYNMSYLVHQQEYMNQRLHARGHLFLNEVYDVLGIPRTQAGAVVGWVEGNGDNYVDFGIFTGTIASRNFVNGYERVILLDFNVDGIIYDKI